MKVLKVVIYLMVILFTSLGCDSNPYNEEEVSFTNRSANVKLAGILTRPSREPPYPAVILISGGVAHDRDYTIFGHRPFLVLSDYLTRRGGI